LTINLRGHKNTYPEATKTQLKTSFGFKEGIRQKIIVCLSSDKNILS